MSEMFEYAVRNKLRFQSPRGDLTVEQLWDVPLRSKDDFNLNTVAQFANRSLATVTEESFVEAPTATHMQFVMKLETVKYVIATKLAEAQAAEKRAANKLEKAKLLRILAEKQDGELLGLSKEDLQKRIEALEA